MLTLPAALSLGLVAVPLLATFFQGGAFVAHDVLMTRNALVGYSIGLIGMLLVKVLAPAFYARQDIRTPVRIGIITLIATQIMNVIFIFSLKYAGMAQHAGLALAIGLGACINSGILFYLLRKRGIFQPEPGWLKFAAKISVALLALGLVLWFGMGTEQHWLTTHGWARIVHLSWLVALGVVVYFAVLGMLGFRLKDFSKRGAT
jgi:putative peptidoglycan lipid II flippase